MHQICPFYTVDSGTCALTLHFTHFVPLSAECQFSLTHFHLLPIKASFSGAKQHLNLLLRIWNQRNVLLFNVLLLVVLQMLMFHNYLIKLNHLIPCTCSHLNI